MFNFSFKNITSFNYLFFSLLNLFLSNLHGLTRFCLLDLFFGGFDRFSWFINDNFALIIFKLAFFIYYNNWSFFFFNFSLDNITCFNYLFFSLLNLFLSNLDGLTCLCLFDLFIGSFDWFSWFINDSIALIIF